MNAGYYDEAQAWRDWLLRAAAGAPSQLQIMYGLAGERRLPKIEVPWLPGLRAVEAGAHRQRRARPTAARRLRRGDGRAASGAARRAGNARRRLGVPARAARTPRDDLAASRTRASGRCAASRSTSPISKVMAWVALDRGIQRDRSRSGSKARSTVARGAAADSRRGLRARVRPRARELRPVVRLEGARRQPAAAADGRVPAAGRSAHHAARSPRSSATCSSTGSCCATTRGRADDGLPPGEGAFLACSFWLADAYVLMGRMDDARALFERLLGAAERRRSAGGGVRHATRGGWSAIFRRRSRTSRWSTPRTT